MSHEVSSNDQAGSVAFLIGAGRSGTTLLHKLLSLHPEIAYISNYDNKASWLPPGLASRTVADRIDVKLNAWFNRGGNAYFIKRPWLKKLCPTPHEGELLYARCGLPLEVMQESKPAALVIENMRQRFEQIRVNSGATVIVSKRTANNRRIEALDTIFPAAKYVNLVRDGREVAQSLSLVEWWDNHPLWWDGRTPLELESTGEDRLSICAKNWALEVEKIDAGLGEISAERVHTTRFEQLLADPIDQLGDIIRFLGLSVPDQYISAIKSLGLSYKPGRWSSDWSAEQLSKVMQIEQPLLDKLGYR